MNIVILVGNLGADADVKTFQSGSKVMTLRLATSESWRDKTTGERKEQVEWHSVSLFGDAWIDAIRGFLTKGTKISVQGKLVHRKWQDQHGNNRVTTEVVVRSMSGGTLDILSPRRNGGEAPSNPDSGDTGPATYGGAPVTSMDDDEIPF